MCIVQTSIKIINYWQQSYINRYGESADVFCQQTATKEEEKVKNSLHQPPNIWVGEKIFISEIFIAGRQRRDCCSAGTVQCPGKTVSQSWVGQAVLCRITIIVITGDEWCFMMLVVVVVVVVVGVRQKCSRWCCCIYCFLTIMLSSWTIQF